MMEKTSTSPPDTRAVLLCVYASFSTWLGLFRSTASSPSSAIFSQQGVSSLRLGEQFYVFWLMTILRGCKHCRSHYRGEGGAGSLRFIHPTHTFSYDLPLETKGTPKQGQDMAPPVPSSAGLTTKCRKDGVW